MITQKLTRGGMVLLRTSLCPSPMPLHPQWQPRHLKAPLIPSHPKGHLKSCHPSLQFSNLKTIILSAATVSQEPLSLSQRFPLALCKALSPLYAQVALIGCGSLEDSTSPIIPSGAIISRRTPGHESRSESSFSPALLPVSSPSSSPNPSILGAPDTTIPVAMI